MLNRDPVLFLKNLGRILSARLATLLLPAAIKMWILFKISQMMAYVCPLQACKESSALLSSFPHIITPHAFLPLDLTHYVECL